MMNSLTMYEQIADFYDLVHKEYKDDILFVIRQAMLSGDPVLELGCGTGRMVVPIAKAGQRIVGLDNSEAMLGIAHQHVSSESTNVQQRISLVTGDMTSFELDERFGTIIIPHNTLMHLTRSQVKNCFRRVRLHLRKEGRLLIDVENPLSVADESEDDILLMERSLINQPDGDNILQMSSSWVDPVDQIRHITWIFDVSPREGGPVRRTIVESDFHYLFAHEMEMALDSSGLRMVTLYGDYDATPYGEDTPRMFVLAAPN